MAEAFISAPETARRTGLTVGALAKRRYLKKAPHGWIYVSSNTIAYPEFEVERFVSERRRHDTRSGALAYDARQAVEAGIRCHSGGASNLLLSE